MTILQGGSPTVPTFGLDAGMLTPFGIWVPPGAKVAGYVRSTGRQSNDPIDENAPIFTTLNAALAQCRSGMGDIVVLLPGHIETIATANQMTNLVAGTQIIGCGYGSIRPTLNWTAAAASFLINVANVTISNCTLNMAATASTVVAAPITVSAAGFQLLGCRVQFCTATTALSTIGITTTTGGTDMVIAGCDMDSGTSDGSNVTTHIRLVGASRLKMYDCKISGATSSVSVGVVQFLTTASLDVDIRRCVISNAKALSACAVTGMAGATGSLTSCQLNYLDTSSTTFSNTKGSLTAHGCTVTNTAGTVAVAAT